MDNNRARITIKLGQANEAKNLDEERDVSVEETDDQIEREQSPNALEEERTTAMPATERGSSGAKSFFSTIKAPRLGKERFVEKKEAWFGPRYVASEENVEGARRPFYRDVQSKGMLGVAASMIGAVAVGVVFGFVVLSFFNSGMIQNTESTSVASSVGERQTSDNPERQEVGSEDESSSSIALPGATNEPLAIQVPATTYYVAQGGVFKDRASAASVVEEMKSKGLPSYFSGEEPAHLFLGIGVERDHILAVAAQLQETEVYVKEITDEAKTLSVSLKEGIVSSQEEWDQWFKRERAFVNEVGSGIRAALNTGNITAEQFAQTTNSHRELLQAGREIVAKLPESEQSLGNRLLNDYTKAVTAMEQYQKQPAVGYLWQAQQALLDAYANKEKLFASFE